MKVISVIVDDKIDYMRFIDIININTPPFQIMEFNGNIFYISNKQTNFEIFIC